MRKRDGAKDTHDWGFRQSFTPQSHKKFKSIGVFFFLFLWCYRKFKVDFSLLNLFVASNLSTVIIRKYEIILLHRGLCSSLIGNANVMMLNCV